MLKLIAMDMDGTLLSHDNCITEDNINALHSLDTTDICIASGRDYESVLPILNHYDLKAYGIYGNGAQLRDSDGKLLKSYYFPKNRLLEVVSIFLGLDIDMMVFCSKQRYFSLQDPIKVRDDFIYRCHQRFHQDIKELYEKTDMACHQLILTTVDDLIHSDIDIIKVEAFDLNLKKLDKAREKLKDIQDIAYLSSFDDNIEVTHKHAQKGYILEELCTYLHISKEEVIVMGDGMNDITLFEQFPYSYAPSNAVDTIKEKAYKIVSSHKETDVKDAIENFIKNKK